MLALRKYIQYTVDLPPVWLILNCWLTDNVLANVSVYYLKESPVLVKFPATFLLYFSSILPRDYNMPSLTLFFYGPGDQLDIKHAPWQSSSIAPGGAITFYCPISKGHNSCFNCCKWAKWDMLSGWLTLKYNYLRVPSEWNMAAFVVVVVLMDAT